jgi:hypothetical protein
VDSNTLLVSVIGGLVTALGVLALVVKSFLNDKKPNGNGVKQSRECWEQHQTVLGKLGNIERDIELLQKTMDSRTPLFDQIKERLSDLNISVSHWDGRK